MVCGALLSDLLEMSTERDGEKWKYPGPQETLELDSTLQVCPIRVPGVPVQGNLVTHQELLTPSRRTCEQASLMCAAFALQANRPGPGSKWAQVQSLKKPLFGHSSGQVSNWTPCLETPPDMWIKCPGCTWLPPLQGENPGPEGETKSPGAVQLQATGLGLSEQHGLLLLKQQQPALSRPPLGARHRQSLLRSFNDLSHHSSAVK